MVYDLAVVGLGYVGLPLCIQFAKVGCRVLGLDIDAQKVDAISNGRSYIHHISSDSISKHIASQNFSASVDFSKVRLCKAVLLCVPTPLGKNREPDLSFIRRTGEQIAPHLAKGTLVVLESTTYPGTTDEDLRGVLEAGSGLTAGNRFSLGILTGTRGSRQPGSQVSRIPKVVGGFTPACLDKAVELYSGAIDTIVPVSTCRVAEATNCLRTSSEASISPWSTN